MRKSDKELARLEVLVPTDTLEWLRATYPSRTLGKLIRALLEDHIRKAKAKEAEGRD